MYMISSPLKRALENSSDTSFMDFNVVASTGCPNEAAKPVLKPSCCLDSVDNLIKNLTIQLQLLQQRIYWANKRLTTIWFKEQIMR